MVNNFSEMLAVGGKSNSLGRVNEVIDTVLGDESRLEELYVCILSDDAWVRMRAADGLEKVCRVHPEWFESYVDRLFDDMGTSSQPSLQWHFAQMLGEIKLTPAQNTAALQWLEGMLKSVNTDWIAAASAMSTVAQFAKEKRLNKEEAVALLKIQQQHASASVQKRAQKLLAALG